MIRIKKKDCMGYYFTIPEDTIRKEIAEPLDKFFSGWESSINWVMLEGNVNYYNKIPNSRELMHKVLQDWYWKYLTDDIPIQAPENEKPKHFLRRMINDYEGLGEWIGQMDIMKLVGELLEYHRTPTLKFFPDMKLLLQHGYAPYISTWNMQRIKEEIDRLSVQKEPKRAELFCVMEAYHSIAMAEDLSDRERMEMYGLLADHWQYLVHIYSVMVKRIIGLKFKYFIQVVNNVNILTSYHPYIHLFYDAVLLRQDDIFPTEKDKEKAVKHILRTEDIMKEVPRDDLLDGLCKVLFGKEFEELIERKKPLSYDELNQQLENYREALNATDKKLEFVVEQLKLFYEAAIPISIIENELLKLDYNFAWQVFSQLNMLLTGQEAWMKNAPAIKDKIESKRDYHIQHANIHVGGIETLENKGNVNIFD